MLDTFPNPSHCWILLFGLAYWFSVTAQEKPALLGVKKIWDEAPHNAFTDLIRFKSRWYCTFREGERHVHGRDGTIRILVSDDGEHWESAASLSTEAVDLRDPKLSITPEGRLMLLMGGSVFDQEKLVTCRPRVAFSDDGRTWTPPRPILTEGEWLWRVTWYERRAYGVAYSISDGIRSLMLYCSEDGIHYDLLTHLQVPGKPNETTLGFLSDGGMIALVRREGGNQHAWIGTSKAPFSTWSWHETEHRIGGPNIIALPDGQLWGAGRSYEGKASTVLARFDRQLYEPALTLPSSGDNSYPGLAWHQGLLWMSYYSSHEGKAAIYLAKVNLP